MNSYQSNASKYLFKYNIFYINTLIINVSYYIYNVYTHMVFFHNI
jgi:hypothetical protein